MKQHLCGGNCRETDDKMVIESEAFLETERVLLLEPTPNTDGYAQMP